MTAVNHYEQTLKVSEEYDRVIERAQKSFDVLRKMTAPERGTIIEHFGRRLVAMKGRLSTVITESMGKHVRESAGEVQECIDMCRFATGLSRQLYGLTMPSERPDHRLQETWLPLGPTAIITAFNFPMAVWAWNFCLAFVAGNSTIWKPSPHTPRCSQELKYLWDATIDEWMRDNRRGWYGQELKNAMQIWTEPDLTQHAQAALRLARDRRIPLVSFTGSTKAGKRISRIVGARLGRCILELGGNNASIIDESANLELAIRGCVFAAIGTSGQRCTTLRRLFVHHKIFNEVVNKLRDVYQSLTIGNPMDDNVVVGPLLNQASADLMEKAVYAAQVSGCELVAGGGYAQPSWSSTHQYHGPLMRPALLTSMQHRPCMDEEVFAPILYVVPYGPFEEAISLVNSTNYGLSSSLYSTNMHAIEHFLRESYNGIVNINTSTSGAEIGLAFGGVKDTGWGVESGSDAWKQYCRRVSSAINHGITLPLSQGLNFSTKPKIQGSK